MNKMLFTRSTHEWVHVAVDEVAGKIWLTMANGVTFRGYTLPYTETLIDEIELECAMRGFLKNG